MDWCWTPLHADDHRHGMPFVPASLDVGEGLRAYEPLGHFGEFDRCPVDIRIDPIPRGLVDGHARQALHVLIASFEPRKANDERFQAMVAAKLTNILRTVAQFRQHRR